MITSSALLLEEATVLDDSGFAEELEAAIWLLDVGLLEAFSIVIWTFSSVKLFIV